MTPERRLRVRCVPMPGVGVVRPAPGQIIRMNRLTATAAVAVLTALGVAACDGTGARAVSAAIGDVRDATLEVASGADSITVRSEDLGDDLYIVSTPDDAPGVPTVERDGDLVRVRLVDDDARDD